MKKQLLFTLALLVVTLCLGACSSSSRNELPASTIKDLASEQLKLKGKDAKYRTIKTGYYELNDNEDRYTLRKLAAAGMITYKCDRIKSFGYVKNGYNWWTGKTLYKKVNKNYYFVDVQLTKDGQRCVVDELPEIDEPIDKDLLQPEPEYYPEFDVPKEEVFPEDIVAEEKPAETNAAEENVVEEKPVTKEQPASDTQQQEATEPVVEKTPLELAREKEHSTEHYVLCFRTEVIKVRNIELHPTTGRAEAEYIVEIYDVTPFGRIYDLVIDDMRDSDKVELKYYEDKGWVID